MLIGHYGASLAAKALDRRIPLWVLFVAAQLVDIFWVIFLSLGVEKIRITPHFTASNDIDNYYIPFTHGALPTLGWALLGFAGYRALCRYRGWAGAAWVVALVVLSHWAFDLIVHVPDLPLLGDHHKVGFGLWNHKPLAFMTELAFVLVGGGFYLARLGPGRTLNHKKGLLGLILLLLILCTVNYYGPAQTTVQQVLLGAVAVYGLLTALVAWLEARGWIG
ncbi:MAG: hypothetical protein ACI9TH_003055 [Kiritimatiellia bacterium]|jgi:hypothetical protein